MSLKIGLIAALTILVTIPVIAQTSELSDKELSNQFEETMRTYDLDESGTIDNSELGEASEDYAQDELTERKLNAVNEAYNRDDFNFSKHIENDQDSDSEIIGDVKIDRNGYYGADGGIELNVSITKEFDGQLRIRYDGKNYYHQLSSRGEYGKPGTYSKQLTKGSFENELTNEELNPRIAIVNDFANEELEISPRNIVEEKELNIEELENEYSNQDPVKDESSIEELVSQNGAPINLEKNFFVDRSTNTLNITLRFNKNENYTYAEGESLERWIWIDTMGGGSDQSIDIATKDSWNTIEHSIALRKIRGEFKEGFILKIPSLSAVVRAQNGETRKIPSKSEGETEEYLLGEIEKKGEKGRLVSYEDIPYLLGGGMIRGLDDNAEVYDPYATGSIVYLQNQGNGGREVEINLMHYSEGSNGRINLDSGKRINEETIKLKQDHFDMRRVFKRFKSSPADSKDYLAFKIDEKIVEESITELQFENNTVEPTGDIASDTFGEQFSRFSTYVGAAGKTAQKGSPETYDNIVPSYECQDHCRMAPYKLKIEDNVIFELDKLEKENYVDIRPETEGEVNLTGVEPGNYLMEVWKNSLGLQDGYQSTVAVKILPPGPEGFIDAPDSKIMGENIDFTVEVTENGTYRVESSGSESELSEEITQTESFSIEASETGEIKLDMIAPGDLWNPLDSDKVVDSKTVSIEQPKKVDWNESIDMTMVEKVVEIPNGERVREVASGRPSTGGPDERIIQIKANERLYDTGKDRSISTSSFTMHYCSREKGSGYQVFTRSEVTNTGLVCENSNSNDIENNGSIFNVGIEEEVSFGGSKFTIVGIYEDGVLFDLNAGTNHQINVGSSRELELDGENVQFHVCDTDPIEEGEITGDEKAEIAVTEEEIGTEEVCMEKESENQSEELSIEVTTESIRKNRDISAEIRVSESLAEKGYQVKVEGPEEFSETYETQEATYTFTPTQTGEYTIKVLPQALGQNLPILGELLQGGALTQKNVEVVSESSEWVNYCSEEMETEVSPLNENIIEATECIEQEIIPTYFEGEVPEEISVAEDLCQDLIDREYSREEKVCK